MTVEVGTSVPLSAGATAKVILAFQPEAVIEALLERHPADGRRHNDRSQGDPRRSCLHPRARLGIQLGGDIRGRLGGRSALIDDEAQVAIGAIGIAAPTIRHTREFEGSLREVVLTAAARAMRLLGYRPGDAPRIRPPVALTLRAAAPVLLGPDAAFGGCEPPAATNRRLFTCAARPSELYSLMGMFPVIREKGEVSRRPPSGRARRARRDPDVPTPLSIGARFARPDLGRSVRDDRAVCADGDCVGTSILFCSRRFRRGTRCIGPVRR